MEDTALKRRQRALQTTLAEPDEEEKELGSCPACTLAHDYDSRSEYCKCSLAAFMPKKVLCYHLYKCYLQSRLKKFILTTEENATPIKSNGNCTCASGQFQALKELYSPFTDTCNFH